MDFHRRHRPLGGGASHVRPEEPRILESWDGFASIPEGTAPTLAAAAAAQLWAGGGSPPLS
ncbi:DUF6087 family protein [Streptomyces sp. 4.24]|uniref:DUF6087 family protein n=1 Tax=Streptomyces tritrimontium TaxID=3406573 RepID=UPI003BB58CA5